MFSFEFLPSADKSYATIKFFFSSLGASGDTEYCGTIPSISWPSIVLYDDTDEETRYHQSHQLTPDPLNKVSVTPDRCCQNWVIIH